MVIIEEPVQDMGQDAEDASSSSPPGYIPAAQAPDRCVQGRAWAPGQQAFRDVTSRAGLDRLDAQGVRISVADYDGDGWPDVVLRRAGLHEDEWTEGGKRAVWLLRNRGDGTFEDVTRASGLVARRDEDAARGRPAEVIAFGDVDNDGDLDAITLLSSPQPLAAGVAAEVMLNRGDGTFELGPLELNALRSPNQAISAAGLSLVDVNRDGLLDAWVTRGGPGQDSLYVGDGRGVFQDVTQAAGLSTLPWQSIQDINQGLAHTNSWASAACDLNGDGSPELLSASYGRSPNHLWVGALDAQGTPSYRNASVSSGYAYDGRQDWTDNESARCHCQLNRQAPGCQDVPAPRLIRCQSQEDVFRWRHESDREPYRLGGNSGTTVCADLNHDGHLDLLTTEIVHWDVGSSSDPSEILYNRGDATFERPGPQATGLTRPRRPESPTWDDGDITAAVFDFDHDGRQDLYIASTDYPGTRGLLYHQRADGTFELVASAQGVDHTSSHGIGVADIDQDGDLDLILGHSRNRCANSDHCYERGHARVFENVYGASQGNWIQLQLEGGPGTNRAALGARVEVLTDGHKQVQEVDGGHGHYGMQRDLTLHFGLGQACQAQVTVRWPDRALTRQVVTLKAGHRYLLRQGQEPLARKR